VAEVEFEDNSSIRLTPHSQVEFPMLGRDASGTAATAVHLRRGTLYVSLASGKAGGSFRLTAGDETIVPAPGSHLRIDLNDPTARLIVYQGTASVSGPWGSMALTKNRAVSFDLASSAAPVLFRAGGEGPFDAWDRNAVEYHKVRASLAAAIAGSPYVYGLSDLGYYGTFADVGACGVMWRPYLANATWDPYGSGAWAWYPGQGYSWVSLYPWGWAPFHSGQWEFCPTVGWGWRPGRNWKGLSNHPRLITRTPSHKWPVAPAPPRLGEPTLIAVNVKALEPSRQAEDGRFVLRSGSAGLGVPRGVFNNLSKISQSAESHGTAVASLSNRQIQMGLMAPRESSAGSGTAFQGSFRGSASGTQTASASIASHSSSAASSSTSTTSTASSSFVSSGSSLSMASASAASASGAAHH